MSDSRQKIYLHYIFALSSIVFIISMFLPAYNIPLFYMDEFIENGRNFYKYGPLLFGYESLWVSILTIFKSPVALLGSLSNFAVITVWLLYLTKASGDLKLFKSFLAVVTMVSVLIWPVALKIGFLSGYYLWAISSIVISFSYAAMKNYKDDIDDILLDEKITSEAD
jgi:hypothetical protein